MKKWLNKCKYFDSKILCSAFGFIDTKDMEKYSSEVKIKKYFF